MQLPPESGHPGREIPEPPGFVPEDVRLWLAIVDTVEGKASTVLPRRRHGLDRAEVRRAQEARIIVAAASMVTERGFGALTVSVVTKEAGVSTKTFYEIFRTLDDPFLRLFDLLDLTILQLEAVGIAAGSGAEALDRIVTLYATMLTSAEQVSRVLVVEAAGGSPAVRARRTANLAAFTAMVLRVLAHQRVDGLAPSVIAAAVGGCNELAYQALSSPPVDRERLIADLREFALVVIRGADAAGPSRGAR